MKIRDTSKYILELSGKNVEQLGTDKDSLFKFLEGGNKSVQGYIRDLTSFAGDVGIQLFYEYLQNADDARATTIHIYYDEENLLIMNNGSPFYTDKKSKAGEADRKGQLKQILGKGGSDKGGSPDSIEEGSIGKHGQGAKLIFSFLTNDLGNKKPGEYLVDTILHELKGPILFSWNNWSDIEAFRSSSSKQIQLADFEDEDYPLLTKLVYSYYPSYPNERLILIDGQKANVFTNSEYNQFQQFVNKMLSKNSTVDFSKGTMFYIPMGKGQIKNIENNLTRLYNEISISLNFLKSVKRVVINNEVIIKSDYITKDWKTDDNKKYQICYPNKLQNDESIQSNFYQYFPITLEIHGFQFLINSKYFEITNGRQSIDRGNDYNKNILKNIAASIHKNLEGLKTKRSEFLLLYTAILNSGDAEERKGVFKKFHKKLIETISKNIPVEGGNYLSDADRVIICNTSLKIKPVDLGVSHLEIIDKQLLPFDEELKSVLGIEEWSLLDLVENADNNDIYINWVKGLSDKEYEIFLLELESFKTYSDKSLKVFRGDDEDVYSIKDIEGYNNVFFYTDSVRKITATLRKQGCFIVGEQKGSYEVIDKVKEYFDRDSDTLFDKIVEQLKPEELTPYEKWTITNNFINNFKDCEDKIKYELPIFKLVNGRFDSLGNILPNTSKLAPSGILNNFQVDYAERNKDFKIYYLSKENVWKKIIKNWETHILPVLEHNLSGNFQGFYKDFQTLSAKYDKTLAKVAYIKTRSNELVEPQEIFYNPKLIDISESEYNQTVQLIQNLTDFHLIDYADLKILADNDVFGITEQGYSAIRNRLNGDTFELLISELKLLPNLKYDDNLFYHFYIQKDNKGKYYLNVRNKEVQYYFEDKTLNEFLKSNDKYWLLPKELKSIFRDENVLDNPDELASKLLQDIGSERAFINLILERNTQIKWQYAQNIELELSIDEEYKKDSFESVFLSKLIIKEGWEEHYSKYIEIEGRKLSFFTFSEKLSVKISDDRWVKFGLSEVLPSYQGISNVLENVKSNFEERDVRQSILFKAKNKKNTDVYAELKGNVQTPMQIAFLCCYRASNDEKSQYTDIPKTWNDDERIALLNIFFEKEIIINDFFFGIIYSTAENSKYVLESEQQPLWTTSWLNTGKEKEKKLDYLYQVGVQKPNSKYVEIRKAIQENRLFDDTASIAKDDYFANNTIQWKIENRGRGLVGSSNRHRIIKTLISENLKKEINQPTYLLQIEDQIDNHVSYSIVKYDDYQNKGLAFDGDREHLTLLLKGVEKYNKALIDVRFYSSQEKQKIKFPKVELRRTFAAAQIGTTEEWRASYYQQWIKDEEVEFKIFLSRRNLPTKNTMEFDGKEYEISTTSDGKIERYDSNEGDKNTKNIYLYKGGFEAALSILSILEQHQQTLFEKNSEKAQFIKLLGLATPNEEEENLLKTLKKEGINTAEKLASLLRGSKNETGDAVSSVLTKLYDKHKPNTDELEFIDNNFNSIINAAKSGRIGRYDFDIDLTNEQQKALNKSLADLLKLMDILSLDDIKYLLKEGYLKRLKETVDEETRAKPMYHVGYIGERLIYLYLKHIRQSEVEHTALPPLETPAYDLVLREKGEAFQIDVKSTIQSIWENDNSIPFYVKRSQYRYISENPKINYFIVRLSLKDLELEEYARGYKDRINVENKELCDKIDKHLMLKLNDNNWRNRFLKQIIFFQLEAPNKKIRLFDVF